MSTRMLARAALLGALSLVSFAASAQVNVQDLADRWVAAYNRHDRDNLAALYTSDARLMVHGSPTVAGRDSIEAFWAADFQEGDPLTLLTVTNSVTGVDMMLVHGDYRVIDRTDGSLLGAGRFAHVWKLEGREWRLDRDLWNQPWEPYDVTSAATDVQQLANRWVEAYNNHDRAAIAALYEPNAALMMHGAPTIEGRRAIGDFWAVDFEEGNPLTLLTVTHAVDGVDMVLVHGNYEVVGREDGLLLGLGRFAHIWFLENGEWRLDRDLWVERSEPL
ncbi:MAG: nuclear transport factor 2 family protein [Gammaproteobacteria bacterium]